MSVSVIESESGEGSKGALHVVVMEGTRTIPSNLTGVKLNEDNWLKLYFGFEIYSEAWCV